MAGNKKYVVLYLFWFLLALAICWGAVQLDLGVLTEPGPGFMPFIMGLLLFVLTLAALFEKRPATEKTSPSAKQLGKVAMTMAALFVYALLLPIAGFIPVTLLLMLFLFAVIQKVRWPAAIVASLLSVTVCYFLFSSLGAEFPKGLFF